MPPVIQILLSALLDADDVKGIADGQKLFRPLKTTAGEANNYLNVFEVIYSDFYINENRWSDKFYIVRDLKERAVISARTIRKWRMKLVPKLFGIKNDMVIIDLKILKRV